jgi:DNA-directed RNA polymerase specialized sigma subunit
MFSDTERLVFGETMAPTERDYCEPGQIEELVLALPEPLQSVVRLRLDSKSLTDIAAIRGVSVGTISRQFRKAVELLKISAANN